MIEAYAFLVMFTMQILVMSVLTPASLIIYMRRQLASIPTERLAQLRHAGGVDFVLAQERFFTRYRALNTGIAVLGVSMLAWRSSYIPHADWGTGLGRGDGLVAPYYALQVLPTALLFWHQLVSLRGFRRSLLGRKRKALLQRRGLFDFVSPFLVIAAILGYILFAAFMICIRQRAIHGLDGLTIIGVITGIYAVNVFVVRKILYGKKPNLFETNADRLLRIGLIVKACVFSCIACVAFFALYFALELLELQRWEPFAVSGYLMITWLPVLMLVRTLAPQASGADGPGPGEPLTPGTPDLSP